MVITIFRIPYRYGQSINFKIISDIHLGAKACDRKAFKKYLEDSNKSTYFIGIGDLYDSIVVKDKRYQKSTDSTEGDAIIDEQIDEGEEFLYPYKNRIIGLGMGNHEDDVLRIGGTDMISRTCRRLETNHLGWSGLIKLILSENKSRTRTVTIRYHHGWGAAARTEGGSLTKYSKDRKNWDADIFLYGHDHHRIAKELPRLGLVGKKLIAKPQHICLCGTFLRTYLEGKDATYGEKKGYDPVAIGCMDLIIKPTKNWVKVKVQ